MIDYQYIFAMIKNFSVKYSGTPRSWQQIVCISGGQSCLRCGLWMDGIEKQITWKTWRQKTQKTWKDPGNRLFALCEGQSCLRCGYLDMSDIPPICWLGCCIMLENGWNLKNRLKLEKWFQHSKVPKPVTLLIFLLLICCSLYLPLSTYLVGVWQTQ